MAGPPSNFQPSTPKKKGPQEFDLFIENLNQDYGLGIVRPDPHTSPKKARELSKNEPGDVSQIWQRLHYHFFNKNSNTIHDILADFETQAPSVVSVHPTGIEKFLKIPQTARATTPRERQVLESLLSRLLDGATPAPAMTPKRSLGRALSGPAAYGAQARHSLQQEQLESSATGFPGNRAKRPSDDWSDDVSLNKRARGLHETLDRPKSAAGVLDSVPVRIRVGQSVAENTHSLYVSRSTNTSRTSFRSDILSGPEDDSRSSSQTTVEGSTSQGRDPRQATERPSQDNFPVSSSQIQALNESFSVQGTVTTPVGHSHPSSREPGREYLTTPWREVDWEGRSAHAKMQSPVNARARTSNTLQDRLADIWPSIPVGLEDAPFPVLWEVTRVALHCGVDLRGMTLKSKAFPPKPSAEAWEASLSHSTSNGRTVVFSGSLDCNQDKSGPFFSLRLHPLALDDSYRLNRRFGADRFLELVCPSLKDDDSGTEAIINWLVRESHWLVGRQWAPFYLKDVGYKKPAKEVRLGPEPKAVVKDRIYFFAEDGLSFVPPRHWNVLPSKDEVKSGIRTRMTLLSMLEWALELTQNTHQPCLKLFQRTALVLSKTRPTVTFHPHQIRHRQKDLLSPVGKVMNDGAGQMSRGVALKIRDILGLPDIPSAVQGRLGSAKGMWVVDVKDKTDDLWIETYPSQRKWICSGVDEDHRTLEIRGYPREPRSAHFNLQLLPVLEDRAPDKQKFRQEAGKLLQNNLQEDLNGMKNSMRSCVQFRQWIQENSPCRHERVERGKVPFLGGLPENDEETMNFLVDAGFDPMKQRYLQDLAWQAQKRKCDDLQKSLRIKIELSAYVYMIPDFLGLLKEGEVHMSFSSKFQNGAFSDSILHDIDLLVARNPAHFNSDVRKVKARFVPELHFLKDVIIFSTKGNEPLADWLSGGDYDGDMAWVCWDPIINNFENAPLPKVPDLCKMGYLRKDKETMGDLTDRYGMRDGLNEMLVKSFRFNMRGSLLGICTNYKERLCYRRNTINDKHAITMSALVSDLVDQAKQGIDFTVNDFNRLRRDYLKVPPTLDEPAYKYDSWNWKSGAPDHIIDFLKFSIAKQAIDTELEALHRGLNGENAETNGRPKSRNGQFGKALDLQDGKAEYWDPDLTFIYDNFAGFRQDSRSCKALLDSLQHDIETTEEVWRKTMGGPKTQDDYQFSQKVDWVYQAWKDIKPDASAHEALHRSKTIAMLLPPSLGDSELSWWALLKASFAFKLFYKRSPRFLWRMAGRQLQWLKAMRVGGAAVMVTPAQYAILRPDSKMVKQIVARQGGNSTIYDDDDVDMDDDDE